MSLSTKRILIKVGTNVLQRDNGKLDYNRISELAEEISELCHEGYEILLVSSGAVGAGREFQSFDKVDDELKRQQMMAAVGQVRLMQVYSEFFSEAHVTIAQILVSQNDFSNKKTFENIQSTLEGLLGSGVLPIINENDAIATEELELNQEHWFSDNDRLAVYIASMIQAQKLFFLTTTPGVLASFNPEQPEASELIETVTNVDAELLEHCKGSSQGGRGGMQSKVEAAGAAMSLGIDTYIVAGKEPQIVKQTLEGGPHGTHFIANGKRPKGYEAWVQTVLTS